MQAGNKRSLLEVRRFSFFVHNTLSLVTAQGRQGKRSHNSCQGKQRELEILLKHRENVANFVYPKC